MAVDHCGSDKSSRLWRRNNYYLFQSPPGEPKWLSENRLLHLLLSRFVVVECPCG